MTARPAFHDYRSFARLAEAGTLQTSPDLALLDRLWMQALQARDEPALDAATLTRLTTERRAAAVLYPHAAARWAWFADGAAALAWGRNRLRARPIGNTSNTTHGTGVLITRIEGTVRWQPLDAAGHAFLCLFADGGTLAQAESAAHAAYPAANRAHLAQLPATLLAAGAFSRMSMTRVAPGRP